MPAASLRNRQHTLICQLADGIVAWNLDDESLANSKTTRVYASCDNQELKFLAQS